MYREAVDVSGTMVLALQTSSLHHKRAFSEERERMSQQLKRGKNIIE